MSTNVNTLQNENCGNNLLKGKRGIIFGALNEKSIAESSRKGGCRRCIHHTFQCADCFADGRNKPSFREVECACRPADATSAD